MMCVAGMALMCVALPARRTSAQDMEPRAYSASPVGLNFLGIGYGWLTGSVILDPTLPISDIHATVQGPRIGIGHTFNLLGDLGLVTAVVPYAIARVTGNVFEQGAEARRSGLSDVLFKLSVNLIGNPAVSPREFRSAPPRDTIVGASITVAAPVGQYDDTKLINLGTNRWSFKPEMGISVPKGRWYLDAYGGVWLFTANRNFFPGGSTRTQDPVLTIQGHITYEFPSGLWIAVDGTSYRGGSTRVNDGNPSPALNKARAGVTLSIPVASYQVKVIFSSGGSTRVLGNFNTLSAIWQMSWLTAH